MRVNLNGPWFHPAAEKLLRYAEAGLSKVEAARVRAHLDQCVHCGEEVRLAAEALNWLGKVMRQEEVEGLATIRARLIAELGRQTPQPDLGACARLCLGPRSLLELGRRLRRFHGGTPAPVEVAAPMLAAFVGRKALLRGESSS